jgi:molybdopterin/thiamine biosynthesis adenylyltransferase/rhodanese-related sulfurtransferase
MTNRYIRQIALAEIGADGQARLAAASALVVGAGGLGSPVLQTLAGAGVGRIVIVDHDHVEESNLHRQPLYRMADIGSSKAETARDALLRTNPEIAVTAVVEQLTPQNAAQLIAASSMVIDAADNFAVTYILSDACRGAGKPLVSASVIGLSGYAGAFCGGGPSYRAVFPEVPAQAGNCATLGVLASSVAVVGAIQAHMALHLILGIEPAPLGRVVTFDGQRMSFGGFEFADCPEPAELAPFIHASAVTKEDIVIDLRSLEEAPHSPYNAARRIGLDDIGSLAGHEVTQRLVLCCRSGQRSLRAAGKLQALGFKDLALVALGDQA